jgi:hypothetical protein
MLPAFLVIRLRHQFLAYPFILELCFLRLFNKSSVLSVFLIRYFKTFLAECVMDVIPYAMPGWMDYATFGASAGCWVYLPAFFAYWVYISHFVFGVLV